MPISPWYCKPEREFNFSSCSEWKKFLKRFSGSTKECATEDRTLNHNLVNISFFKIDELGLVGKCVKHSFRIYMRCYLQFCIKKKLRPVNKNLSKVHFFHILSTHAKGLMAINFKIRPLLLFSLFRVTRARSFFRKQQKKKKNSCVEINRACDRIAPVWRRLHAKFSGRSPHRPYKYNVMWIYTVLHAGELVAAVPRPRPASHA